MTKEIINDIITKDSYELFRSLTFNSYVFTSVKDSQLVMGKIIHRVIRFDFMGKGEYIGLPVYYYVFYTLVNNKLYRKVYMLSYIISSEDIEEAVESLEKVILKNGLENNGIELIREFNEND